MDVDDPMGKSYPWYPKLLRIAWHRALEAIATGDEIALRGTLVDHPDLATDVVISRHLMSDAVEHGRVGTVAVLLEAGFPTDERGDSNETVLLDAAWHGYADVVRLLLEAGADPDLAAEEDGSYGDPEASGRCALWAAIYRGHREIIDVLEPVTSKEMRMRAYEAASERRAMEFERELPYSDETIWLFRAARYGDLESLSDAIEAGGDVNVNLRPEELFYGGLGSTPLALAAGQGRLDLIYALLRAGADPDLVDHLGKTAADFAASNGHDEVVARLRSPRAGG